MIVTKHNIKYTDTANTPIIEAVQGDTGRTLLFVLGDYRLTEGTTARYYIMKPSGESVYNDATVEVSTNTVTVELTAQSLAEIGDAHLQVRLTKDEETITSFEAVLRVMAFRGIGAVESSTEANIFDKQVEEAKEEIDTALDEHLENGIFPSMTAGGLVGDSYAENKVPYFFRPSGGGTEVGTIEAPVLVGGSVGFNQLVYANGSATLNRDTQRTINISTNSKAPITNHVYLYSCNVTADTTVGGLNFQYGVNRSFSSGTGKKAIIDKASSYSTAYVYAYIGSGEASGTALTYENFSIIDLTLLLGSTIADRLYTLEQSTAGSGIAQLRAWGFDFDEYIPYSAPTLKHVEGVSAHVMRDADDNIIGNYPLDASLTLRGVPKLDSNNSLYYDGDTYEPDGTVTRNCAVRAYQSGDESLADAITDGTNTVYKLSTPTTETATPFTEYQEVDASGTEEYVSTGVVPVGHVTKYPTDLKGTFETILSAIPSANGTYALKVTVANGKHTFSWV